MGIPKDSQLQLLELYRKVFWSNPEDEHVLLTLAESYMRLEAYQEAIPFLRRVLAFNPKNPTAHIQLGWALMNVGTLNEAMVHYALCDVYDEGGKLDAGATAGELLCNEPREDALAALREVYAKVPEALWFEYLLAWYAKGEEKLEEAIRHYSHLLVHAQNLRWYDSVQEDWALIKDKLSEGIEKLLEPVSSRGDRDFENSNYGQAIKVFEALLPMVKWGERKVELIKKAGRCYEELNNVEAAITQYENLLRYYENSTSAGASAHVHVKVAPLYAKKGEYEKEREHIERAVALYREAGINFTPSYRRFG